MNEQRVKLSNLIAPNFADLHRAVKGGLCDTIWCIGGRGSLKSSFIATEILVQMMRDEEANAIAFRKIGNNVRDSIKTTFEWAIDKMEMSAYWESKLVPSELIFKPTGQKIVMSGLDDPKKIKSKKLRKGYFKYSWFEELDEFDGPDQIRSVNQSIIRGDVSHLQFASFNPPRDPDHWANKETERLKPSRIIHRSTYLQAPKEWLGQRFFDDAEELRALNPLAYDHEYLGIATGLAESVIFNGKYVVQEFGISHEWDGPYFGADWGFAADPTTLIRCHIHDNVLYISDEIFEKGLELDQIKDRFSRMEGAATHTIRADSARPETISYVKRMGLRIEGCEKWSGSVEDGIAYMLRFKKIVIHPRCVNLIKEFRLYSYKVDKLSGDIKPDIIDAYNHGIDAIRYALGPMIKRQKAGNFYTV